MQLDSKQQAIAMAALDLAAMMYKTDAGTMRSIGQSRLAEQFDKQHKETFDLARLIENCGDPSPAEDDESREPSDVCNHEWVYTGTGYGGEDESYRGEGRCYCSKCGADGDA